MRVGILDFLSEATATATSGAYDKYFRKQFMGLMPQTISVWCRQFGHEVFYNTYWGQADPLSLLPDDLDFLFVSCFTQSSSLACAVATIFRRKRAITVVGGPHARAFPDDCARFFDIVVGDCDRSLIDDILRGRVDPPARVSSKRPLTEFPLVEERMPEIAQSAFYGGRATGASVVPMLASIGCPYDCEFCVDWNTRYISLPWDRLREDLAFLSNKHPSLLVGYHDPNFAIRFDKTMDVISSLPQGRRNRYVMEMSLSILKDERMPRLAETNCRFVAPGVESWAGFGAKAGVSGKVGDDKLAAVVARLERLKTYVPGIQVNLMFGCDDDVGRDPVRLSQEFIRRTPHVWPTINVPTPYGGTPLYHRMSHEGRVLRTMPFLFFNGPFLVSRPKNYDPIEYYGHLVALNETRASARAITRRIVARQPWDIRFINAIRTMDGLRELQLARRIHRMLKSDAAFRAYHEGRSNALPPFYHALFERSLGRYAEVLPHRLRTPEHGTFEPRPKDAMGGRPTALSTP